MYESCEHHTHQAYLLHICTLLQMNHFQSHSLETMDGNNIWINIDHYSRCAQDTHVLWMLEFTCYYFIIIELFVFMGGGV